VGDWTGRHVVVTGGSSGIGLATAEAFAAKGADVTLVARDLERLGIAREAMNTRRAAGGSTATVTGDVSTLEGCEAIVNEATCGGACPIDVLVSCAGVIIPGYFETMTPRDFEACMDSWRGCVYMAHAAAPAMMARKSGHIVNVSSVAGFMGVFGYTAYSSAKYAVMGFSEALRSEMRPYGIKVSVVCPPDTDTPGLAYEKSLRPAETDKVAGNIAAVAPTVIAKAIVGGVESGKYLIVPGALSQFYRVLKANALWLFFMITDGDVAAARKVRGL